MRTVNVPSPKPDFCAISLGDWLELVDGLLPHIPAHRLGNVPLSELWGAMDGRDDCPHLDAVFEQISAIRRNAVYPGEMVRWDCCSSVLLKAQMDYGERRWDPDSCLALPLDDARFLDILVDYGRKSGRDSLPVWHRPWVAILHDNGYPVEFRVFVESGRLQGVSSYYPQRPLRERYTPWAIEAGRLALQFAQVGSFSMDFALQRFPSPQYKMGDPKAPTMRLTFIEGGPSHAGGAHHCCFQPGEIHGVALANRNEVVS